MKKRFVVLLDSPTPEQNKAFLGFLKETKKFGYWHWMRDSWLLTSKDQEQTTISIRDHVKSMFPDVNNIVIEVPDGSTWSGFGPKGEDRNMFTWIHNTWSDPK